MIMFQKYVSVPKNSKGIYEYDIGVQVSKNLLFYKEIKKKKSYDFSMLHYAISLIAFAKRAF